MDLKNKNPNVAFVSNQCQCNEITIVYFVKILIL